MRGVCVCKDVNKVRDKYVAALELVIHRANVQLTLSSDASDMMTKTRDQFIARLLQHETVVRQKVQCTCYYVPAYN